jgi:pyruvate dehydrogenase E2 component (dihydrolipoyllysine-residue acetyltransferase)
MAEVEIPMPKLSDSMEQATVLAWLKRPGDAVRRGEPLVEVETDKATVVYEAEQDGVLGDIVVDEGGTADLGAVIARLIVEGAGGPGLAPPAASPIPDKNSVGATPHGEPSHRPTRPPRGRATPVARKLAGELGVSVAELEGSGPGGRIVRADVRRAAAGPAPRTLDGRGDAHEVVHTPTQRTIAERMSTSRSTVPDFTVEAEVDMSGVVRLRDDLRFGDAKPLPSFNDFVVRAVALALRERPVLNASYADGRTVRFARVNVGIAVALDDALIVPTIYDADRKSLGEIAVESRRLADAARSRLLSPDEVANGTFTVSNLGMFGVRRFNAVINQPQAAILAVGEVAERPVVADGRLGVGTTMELALSCDHRVVYGAGAATFLRRVRELLEHPTLLVVPEGIS